VVLCSFPFPFQRLLKFVRNNGFEGWGDGEKKGEKTNIYKYSLILNNYSLKMKMITKNTKKIIVYLLRNLNPININQISRELKISVGSAFKILKDLKKEDIVLSEKLGNCIFYKLNLENQETTKICELLLLEEKRNLKGYSKIYAEEIKKFKEAELIILFGSILNKKEFNDVDVLFITNKPREVAGFCLELSKTKTKPIIPLILTKTDIIKEIKSKKQAILEIIKKGVVLKGDDIFVKVIKNAKN